MKHHNETLLEDLGDARGKIELKKVTKNTCHDRIKFRQIAKSLVQFSALPCKETNSRPTPVLPYLPFALFGTSAKEESS